MKSPALTRYLDQLDAEALEAFARRCETSVAYLYQLKGGHRKASVRLARRMREASEGTLKLAHVRPDIWGERAQPAT